jgi:hypothetical protein
VSINLAQQDDLIHKARTLGHVFHYPAGRALVSRNGLRIGLHRLLYREVRGPLTSKEFLRQTCSVEGCVSPWHYEKSSRSRELEAHCVNGHTYGLEDAKEDGTRLCRRCLAKRLARRPRTGGLRQWEIQLQRQFCPYGHPYVPENTYTEKTKSGGTRRKCRVCTRARARGEDPANVSWP